MATPQAQLTFTADDYLALERASEERHEFLDGQIYAMAGESPDHGTICTNLTGLLFNQLKGTPCQVWSKDTKVRSGPLPQAKWKTKGLFSYPDLVVVCGEGEYLDEHRDVLLNPRVIIEVLSPATEAFDRGEKFLRYQTWLPTLSDYLLFSQASPMVTHHVKREDGGWSLYFYEGLKESFLIQSINCPLVMAEVYDRITFSLSADEAKPGVDSNNVQGNFLARFNNRVSSNLSDDEQRLLYIFRHVTAGERSDLLYSFISDQFNKAFPDGSVMEFMPEAVGISPEKIGRIYDPYSISYVLYTGIHGTGEPTETLLGTSEFDQESTVPSFVEAATEAALNQGSFFNYNEEFAMEYLEEWRWEIVQAIVAYKRNQAIHNERDSP